MQAFDLDVTEPKSRTSISAILPFLIVGPRGQNALPEVRTSLITMY